MRHGITLIELLVVLAMFAIVASILLPVFSQSREKAHQTICVGNQRQLAAALLLDAQEHNETLPATAPVTVENYAYWVSERKLSATNLKCPESTGVLSYNFAADLLGANLAAVDAHCQVDTLLTADGTVPANATSPSGVIVMQQDIATTVHDGKGFIAAFLDGHVVFIDPSHYPLYDAIDLTCAAAGAIHYANTAHSNTILYQGAQHVFTYDATTGAMTGAAFTSPAHVAGGAVSNRQYFALRVINIPSHNSSANAATIMPAITLRINHGGNFSSPISVVNFGSPQDNDLQRDMYYTYSVDIATQGVAHTLSASTSGATLALTIN